MAVESSKNLESEVMAEIESVIETDSRPRDGGPLPMKFFSTWEVRKVPPNCVSRLCTVTINRLELVQVVEPGLQSVVLSVSMKTPHRSLRSNELLIPSSGIINISLNLTFSLQYPHFLKRGGNDLQIRLQRRKNRTIRGYKTLCKGEINMGLVLQKSYQGTVKLFMEKANEPSAMVTVSSLTSTPVEDQSVEVSDEEEEEHEDELIFSDELPERGSDTDSENMDPEDPIQEPPKISLKQPSSVLRLLRMRALKGRSRRGVPVEVTLGLEEEVTAEYPASSLSDSYEEEEEANVGHSQATPRPKLRPFFGSDTLSMISLPQPSEIDANTTQDMHASPHKRTSLELAVTHNRIRSNSLSASETLEPLDMPESALINGRLWLVHDNGELQDCLQSLGEPLLSTPSHISSSSLLPLLSTLYNLWHKTDSFLLIVAGGNLLLSSILKAFVTGPSLPLRMCLWPEQEQRSREDGEESILEQSQVEIVGLLEGLRSNPVLTELSIAQATLKVDQDHAQDHTQTTSEATPAETKSIPFIYNMVMGPWETYTDSLPVSPPSEHPEMILEYWSGKKESQKSSVKVRSVMVTVVAGPLLNVTAIARKKGKRIRRAKDTSGEGSIISLTAAHLSCRSTNKGEAISTTIDGMGWPGIISVKLSAQWTDTPTCLLPIVTCTTQLDAPLSTDLNQ